MIWNDISTAPKDGTDILVLVVDGARVGQRVARWSKNMRSSGYYRDMGWMMPGYQGIAAEAVCPPPTRWMPLPQPPKE